MRVVLEREREARAGKRGGRECSLGVVDAATRPLKGRHSHAHDEGLAKSWCHSTREKVGIELGGVGEGEGVGEGAVGCATSASVSRERKRSTRLVYLLGKSSSAVAERRRAAGRTNPKRERVSLFQ